MKHGLSYEEAHGRFWILDVNGLITQGRESHKVPDFVKPFSRKDPKMEGSDLLAVIKEAKPTILIGASTVGGLFTSEHLEGEHYTRAFFFVVWNSKPQDPAT